MKIMKAHNREQNSQTDLNAPYQMPFAIKSYFWKQHTQISFSCASRCISKNRNAFSFSFYFCVQIQNIILSLFSWRTIIRILLHYEIRYIFGSSSRRFTFNDKTIFKMLSFCLRKVWLSRIVKKFDIPNALKFSQSFS